MQMYEHTEKKHHRTNPIYFPAVVVNFYAMTPVCCSIIFHADHGMPRCCLPWLSVFFAHTTRLMRIEVGGVCTRSFLYSGCHMPVFALLVRNIPNKGLVI